MQQRVQQEESLITKKMKKEKEEERFAVYNLSMVILIARQRGCVNEKYLIEKNYEQ